MVWRPPQEMFFAMDFVYGFVTDALVAYYLYENRNTVNKLTVCNDNTVDSSSIADALLGLLFVYYATIIINLALFVIEICQARSILSSHDVSDVFMNTEAYFWKTVTNFSVWCFFRRVQNRMVCKDKVARYVYFTIKNGLRLVVQLVQLIVIIIIIGGIEQFISECVQGAVSINLDSVRIVAYYLKLVYLIIQTIIFAFACVAWPVLNCSLESHYRSESFGLQTYVMFEIDRRINQVLGLIFDPDHPETHVVLKLRDGTFVGGQQHPAAKTGTQFQGVMVNVQGAPGHSQPGGVIVHTQTQVGGNPHLTCASCHHQFAVPANTQHGQQFMCPNCNHPTVA